MNDQTKIQVFEQAAIAFIVNGFHCRIRLYHASESLKANYFSIMLQETKDSKRQGILDLKTTAHVIMI
jgi:hypothetical protein